MGAAQWMMSGWLRRGAPLSANLDVRLAPAACSALFASLPADVRGPLDGLALTGTLGGRARLAVDLTAPVGAGVALDTQITHDCTVIAEPPAADVRTLVGRPPESERTWIALDKLPSFVRRAFVAAE